MENNNDPKMFTYTDSEFEKERKELLDRKESNLLGAYTTYSQFKDESTPETSDFDILGIKEDEQLVSEVQETRPLTVTAHVEKPIELSPYQVDEYLRYIMAKTAKLNASEVHIDTKNNLARVRYRVNGKLLTENSQYVINYDILSQRFKVMAEFFIQETKEMQRGTATYQIHSDKKLDFDVLTLPTDDGEMMLLKIANTKAKFLVGDIGLTREDSKAIDAILNKGSGVVWMSALSGNGRTTSMYAMLRKILSGEKSILTLEKSIFEKIEGVSQIRLVPGENELKKLLKNISEYDFDVIAVDADVTIEDMKLLCNFGLSGKLVLVTTYFPTVYDTIIGLVSMGLEPYVVAASMEGVIAQHLVRRKCKECNGVGRVSGEVCRKCQADGYDGKIGIFEIFRMNRESWSMLLRKEENEMLKKSIENGATSFANNAKILEKEGLTTQEELVRIGVVETKKLV